MKGGIATLVSSTILLDAKLLIVQKGKERFLELDSNLVIEHTEANVLKSDWAMRLLELFLAKSIDPTSDGAIHLQRTSTKRTSSQQTVASNVGGVLQACSNWFCLSYIATHTCHPRATNLSGRYP